MINLRPEEKDLVLDYFFDCGSDEHLLRGKKIIESDARAKELFEQLKSTLGHLDHVAPEQCPDHLAEITVNKLRLASSAENARLQTLLAEEEKKVSHLTAPRASVHRSFWPNLTNVATVAAVLMVIGSVSLPTFSYMRQKARQIACNAGLYNVGSGVARYRNDNNGDLPAVATVAGSPWWKVGDQGEKNQSNTRHPWALVKNGYVQGKDFVCPGRADGVAVNYTQAQLGKLNDFPSRQHIGYSYMFMCDKRAKRQWNGRTVLMADLNPIFETISAGTMKDEFEKLHISDKLRKAMSSNHKRGQMMLFYDGSAVYMKVREISGDDVFTAKDKQDYSGREVPCDIKDIFLVP
jgi:hypothetical protein